ncbi:DddA-like double-stranded DNA deaminase toxin [Glycomyces sp. YM15]|uniref:DddA-like double-stranded DNA deaminase toxin n=1 Tax=Glycomyces sp. YM15 TaxID=2800446 RepID=UPI001964A26E|nr:DddA-like double-stranded DNA deaminase toxin [Glycomyces sp. YM15]
MSNIDEVASAVAARSDEARQLAAGIARTKEEHDKLTAAIAAASLEPKAEVASAIGDDLEAATGRAVALADVLDQLLARVEALKGLLAGSSGSGSGSSQNPTGPSLTATPPKRPWANNPPVPDFHPERPNDTCVEETQRVGWPLNENGQISARGRIYDSDGRAITGTVKAGNGPADKMKDLKEPWASDERMRTRWHIEGHAAAIMRQYKLNTAVIYINIVPCGKASRDQWRCHENLRHLLPKGSHMVVWIVHENGMREKIKYPGTGEALK